MLKEILEKEYLFEISKVFEIEDDFERNKQIIDIENKYRKLFYINNIDYFNYDLSIKLEHYFIIPTKPINYDIDNEAKLKAIIKLRIALNNINNGIPDGISEKDAKIILESTIQNARYELNKDEDIFNNSLIGTCGFSQSLTVIPLMDLGLKTTINNISHFPDTIGRHAFSTCIIPIKENDNIYEKQYLLDATYRQFFITHNCCEGKFYSAKETFKNETGADVGYYLAQIPEGIAFAQELLSKGYVELNSYNARLYGLGFSCQAISFSVPEEKQIKMMSHSGEEYINAINAPLPEELNNDKEELDRFGYNYSLLNDIHLIKNEEITK